MKRRKWLTSPSSGQATINSMLRHHKLLTCQSGAALGAAINGRESEVLRQQIKVSFPVQEPETINQITGRDDKSIVPLTLQRQAIGPSSCSLMPSVIPGQIHVGIFSLGFL